MCGPLHIDVEEIFELNCVIWRLVQIVRRGRGEAFVCRIKYFTHNIFPNIFPQEMCYRKDFVHFHPGDRANDEENDPQLSCGEMCALTVTRWMQFPNCQVGKCVP